MIRPALITCLLLAVAGDKSPLSSNGRSVAVTIDDLPTVSSMPQTNESRVRLTTALLASLKRNGVPAIGFVNEGKLGPRGAPAPEQVALMRMWLDAGLELGNHTWSHRSLHSIPLKEYEAEIVLGDSVLQTLMKPARPRYFRHPFLQAGRDSLVRDSLQQFLTARGYTIAPVTIDNADYMFASVYDRRIAANDSAAADSVATIYVQYMDSVFAYYERQSVALLGREVSQTLLMHANALNARTFDQLAAMMKRRGYRFVTLDEALKDEAYRRRDGYFGPAGISWLHRWAFAEGKRGAFFAGEPVVPDWIEKSWQ